MKKIIFILLSVLMLLSFASCGKLAPETPEPSSVVSEPSPEINATPSPLPEIPEESVEISSLAEYTVVYPRDYASWQMEEIYILRDVIKHQTGKEIDIIPDSAPEREKEIIIAGSNRSTPLDKHINALESRLDYIIAVADNDIILGGLDYFGGMRAAYDFINNYLGYDDIEDVYSTPKNKITGVYKSIYHEPVFTIGSTNFYRSKFPSVQSVKDVADANFNLIVLQAGVIQAYDDEDEFRELLNWCVRFDLRIVLPLSVNEESGEYSMPFFDVYEDNPIVWGHYLRDEPSIPVMDVYSRVADDYKEKFSSKGWKSLINHFGTERFYTYIYEFEGLFDSADVTAFDLYISHGMRRGDPAEGVHSGTVLPSWEYYNYIADRNGQEFWSYIMAYYLDTYNSSKMLRWASYISMCFDADAILYFNYQGHVVDNSYNKTVHWYNAQKANADIEFVGTQLKENYSYAGAFTINARNTDAFTYIEDVYRGFDDVLSDVILPEDCLSPYLVGCYDKKDGDGRAFLLVNIEELDYIPYDETTAEPIKIKINGENVKFYREGELKEVEKDADGYYSIEAGNGHCWFVTVD